jgi:outer membrane protein assembly factor BamA
MRQLACIVVLVVGAGTASAQAPADRTLRIETVEVVPDLGYVQGFVHLRPGDAVDEVALVALREELEDSRSFSRVEVYTRPGSRPGLVVLRVEVALDRRVRFLTGLGYEPLDGWYLTLVGGELRHRPVAGSSVSLAVREGLYVSGLYFEAKAADWRLEASASTQSWFVYEGRDGWQQDIGHSLARVGRQFDLADRVSATAWFGWQWDQPESDLASWETDDEEHRPAADLISESLGDRDRGGVWVETTWDRRDARQPWRAGAWAGARARVGGGFWTAELDGRRVQPCGAHHALAAHVRVAHASDDTPYYQRFSLGGVITNRGYEFGRLSSPAGASDAWQGNLEWRSALVGRKDPLPKVTGLLFLDACQGWDRHGQNLGFGAGVGYGLRIRLPWVQIVGLDVGYPLETHEDSAPFVVHASLGWVH